MDISTMYEVFYPPYTDEEIAKLEIKLRNGLGICHERKHYRRIPSNVIERWSKDEDPHFRVTAMKACSCADYFLEDVVFRGLNDSDDAVREEAISTAHWNVSEIHASTIKKWASNHSPDVRRAAMYACNHCYYQIPWNVVHDGLMDPCKEVRAAASWTCREKRMPTKLINAWAADNDPRIRAQAFKNCCNCDNVSWNLLERGLNDSDAGVSKNALISCTARKDAPLSLIKKWAGAKDPRIRVLSMKASYDRPDVPWEVIEKGLQDPRKEVRETALAACNTRTNAPLPLVKKCIES